MADHLIVVHVPAGLKARLLKKATRHAASLNRAATVHLALSYAVVLPPERLFAFRRQKGFRLTGPRPLPPVAGVERTTLTLRLPAALVAVIAHSARANQRSVEAEVRFALTRPLPKD